MIALPLALISSGLVFATNHPVHAVTLLLFSAIWDFYFPQEVINQEDSITDKALPGEKQFLKALKKSVRSGQNEHTIKHSETTSETVGDEAPSVIEEDCPLCWDSPTDPAHLRCSHVICSSCLLTYLTTSSTYKNCCPVCKATLFRPRFWTEDRKNLTAQKLRVCAAIIVVALTICRCLLCLYIRYPTFNLETSFYCTFPGKPRDYLESVIFFLVAVAMVWCARVTFGDYGGEWWRYHQGGYFNYASTLGTVVQCWHRMRDLEPILAMALRKR
jgi:hypothetical protein